jgi:quercetin dioxygenase-like cupin family protein
VSTIFFDHAAIEFVDHPKYAGVRISILVSKKDTEAVSVCLLEIGPKTEIPIHTHDPQVDSIYVLTGKGEAYINGSWQPIATGDYIFVPTTEEHGVKNTGNAPLRLFVHHSPPFL